MHARNPSETKTNSEQIELTGILEIPYWIEGAVPARAIDI